MKTKISAILLTLLLFPVGASVFIIDVQDVQAEDYAQIPLVVNVLEGVDNATYTDAWIRERVREANDILHQARVQFTLTRIERNVEDPDAIDDGRISDDGDTQLRMDGETELDNRFGNGTGYKITLVNNYTDVNAWALSVHGRRVSTIDVHTPAGPAVAGGGATWAHEFAHAASLSPGHATGLPAQPNADARGHVADRGNLMHSPPTGDNGRTNTTLTDVQRETIRRNGRGWTNSIVLNDFQGGWQPIQLASIILDGLGDTVDQYGSIVTCVTCFDHVDLYSAKLSTYDPTEYLTVLLSLNGLPPASTDMSLVFQVTLNTDNRNDTGITMGAFEGVDKVVSIQLHGVYPFTSEAVLIDTVTGSIITLDPPEILTHYKMAEEMEGYPFEPVPLGYAIQTNVCATCLDLLAESVPVGFVFTDVNASVSDTSSLIFSTIAPALPKIQVTPLTVKPGEKLSIAGTCFTPHSNVTLALTNESMGKWATGGTGSFSAEIMAPIVPAGDYFLDAADSEGKYGYAIVTITTPPVGPDVAVTDVTPSQTVVRQGSSVNIDVTVANEGDCTLSSDVTVYADTTAVAFPRIDYLSSGASTTLTSTWDTTGFAEGEYTISAYAFGQSQAKQTQ